VERSSPIKVPIGEFEGPHPFFNADGTIID
jgi:hypothetical protein